MWNYYSYWINCSNNFGYVIKFQQYVFLLLKGINKSNS